MNKLEAEAMEWLEEKGYKDRTGYVSIHIVAQLLTEYDEREQRWRPIKSEEDLPKETGTYYVTRQLKDGTRITDRRGFAINGTWADEYRETWLTHYAAWMHIQPEPEPYTEGE